MHADKIKESREEIIVDMLDNKPDDTDDKKKTSKKLTKSVLYEKMNLNWELREEGKRLLEKLHS